MGVLWLAASETHLAHIQFCNSRTKVNHEHSTPLLKEAADQLGVYFSGSLTQFDLPLSLSGTLFQQQVQQQLCKLPFGSTISYKTLAINMGKPQAARAVGAACKKNSLLIVIPCHRVISSSGQLTGFAAGIDRKQQLLALEAKRIKSTH
ncbi:MAG: methylated-DNA--[protein]-cysteine S-methyltransferase [Endozoicomonas sp. (ex Botrylloides leachii)]|nr:methylated-DNA--[protein]-cysteine S-methyltransferase [Endozoicomonas sp. (ex Botrylloides leachii)]